MQKNPWNAARLSDERAVLLALRAEPETLEVIAGRASLSAESARAVLDALASAHLAIADEDGYELTGPLSWFGSFANAIAHDARKRFVVDTGDGRTHLYLTDVRVKGRRRPGDPLNETVAVLACAKTSPSVSMSAAVTPSCAECAYVLDEALHENGTG